MVDSFHNVCSFHDIIWKKQKKYCFYMFQINVYISF